MMMMPIWTVGLVLLPLLLLQVPTCLSGALSDDWAQCRASSASSSASSVCDATGKLSSKARDQLEGMLADLAKNGECECQAGGECGDKEYAVRLMVTSGERVEEAGGEAEEGLKEEAERIWRSEGMGDEKCDNGMLLMYIRDQKKMATYQGHGRFRLYTDSEMAQLHQQLMAANNRTGALAALPSPGGDAPTAAEIQRAADDDEENWTPMVGLSIALGLTFLVLFCVLCILLVRCFSACCGRRGRGARTAKYRVNMAPGVPGGYKSMTEPIYIVTPANSEAAFAASLPRHRRLSSSNRAPPPPPPHPIHGPPPMVFFGHPPPPPHPSASSSGPGPFVHHPRSRSATPTSTHRIRRGDAVAPQSMHGTPEQHKREKLQHAERTAPRSNGTYRSAAATTQHSSSSPESSTSGGPRRPPPNGNGEYPFLDPKRRQETQTREQFIG